MDDQVTYMDEREHALVRLFKAHVGRPALLSPDMSRMLEGARARTSEVVDDIPSVHFTHFCRFASDRSDLAQAVLSSYQFGSVKSRSLRPTRYMVRRDESDRMSLKSRRTPSPVTSLRKGQKRNCFDLTTGSQNPAGGLFCQILIREVC